MAKFYCQTGSFEANYQMAILKVIQRLFDSEELLSLFIAIDERGFNNDDCDKYSLIPFFKQKDVILPSDEALIRTFCEFSGQPCLTREQRHWLLVGGVIK